MNDDPTRPMTSISRPFTRDHGTIIHREATMRAGITGGVVGGLAIWAYEALVRVGVQGMMPLAGIPRNAVGLVFGRAVQDGLGAGSYVLGTGIHFVFALAWGVMFAFVWPGLRRYGVEASLAAMPYAAIAWIAMHAAIAIASANHPNYLDPNVVIGGLMSHLFFTVPMALVIKRQLSGRVC